MFKCPICYKNFTISIMFHLHFTKCKEIKKKTIDDEITNNTLKQMKEYQKELEMRISFLEKKKYRRDNITPPTNDYMDWIQGLEITEDDKNDSLSGIMFVIKTIIKRNVLKGCGAYLILCDKLLIGVKVLGSNKELLGYKWEYIKKQHLSLILNHFLDIFKLQFIDWHSLHADKIRSNCGTFKEQYNTYYMNIIMYNERALLTELFNFIYKECAFITDSVML